LESSLQNALTPSSKESLPGILEIEGLSRDLTHTEYYEPAKEDEEMDKSVTEAYRRSGSGEIPQLYDEELMKRGHPSSTYQLVPVNEACKNTQFIEWVLEKFPRDSA